MLVTTERLNEESLVLRVVHKEIDVYRAPELGERITDHLGAYKLFIVDLSQVEYIDSAGLAVLSGSQEQVREMGGSLRIVTTNERVLRAFRIAGVPDMRLVFPTVTAALESALAETERAGARQLPKEGGLTISFELDH